VERNRQALVLAAVKGKGLKGAVVTVAAYAELLGELIQECECKDGCPSCIGPAGENGMGCKMRPWNF
jgi:ATP-dependent helicase YprA (DUF1998 family)